MRIGFLMGRSFTDGSNMPTIVRLLAEWGATAKLLHLGDDLIDVAQVRLDYDLYVLRNRSDLAMSVAADLHAAGAALLNPYPVSTMLRDRIVSSRVLRAAGIPVPETFVASHVSQLLPALDRGPLVLKPYRRNRKGGIEVVTNEAELGALGLIEEPVFAQRYHPPDRGGPNRKIYSLGSELFGVIRTWPARTYEEKRGRPCSLSPELVDIARRCGAAFGIDLFSVDIVESGGRPFVVDMSSFPTFKGVPDAPLRVAQYVYVAAERAARGKPVVPADSLTERSTWSLSSAPSARVARPRIGTLTPRAPAPLAWQGVIESPAQPCPVAAPARPARVRRVSARDVTFSGLHAGDEHRFLLEERTTELDDGTSTKDYIWVRGQYVLVVPVSDSGVVFIRQYKKAAEQTLLVLPWGEIERGESPLDAGRRELEEETGYSYRTAEVYGPFYDLPDKSTGGHWVVVARNAYPKAHPAPDDGELISGIELIPISQLGRHHIPVLMHVGALRLAGL